jgi:hypothetical protein
MSVSCPTQGLQSSLLGPVPLPSSFGSLSSTASKPSSWHLAVAQSLLRSRASPRSPSLSVRTLSITFNTKLSPLVSSMPSSNDTMNSRSPPRFCPRPLLCRTPMNRIMVWSSYQSALPHRPPLPLSLLRRLIDYSSCSSISSRRSTAVTSMIVALTPL